MIRKLALAAMLAVAPATFAPAAYAQAGMEQRVIGDFIPTRDMTSAALGTTAALWSAFDRGDLTLAYGLLSPALRNAVSLPDFVGIIGTTASFGVDRRITRLTWYHDQPQWPGTVLAVDWQASEGGTLLGGGYVIVQQQPDGSFAVHKLDTTDLRIAR